MHGQNTSPPDPRLDADALRALPGARVTRREYVNAAGDQCVEEKVTVEDPQLFAVCHELVDFLMAEGAVALPQWQLLVYTSSEVVMHAAEWMLANGWIYREPGISDFKTDPPTERLLVHLHPRVSLVLREHGLGAHDALGRKFLGEWRRTTKKPKGK